MPYAVTAVEDEGVRVMIDRGGLSDVPDNQVHRLKLRIVDADVLQITRATQTKT